MSMVYGWVKTSLVDYPDHVATVLFTAGCNMDCPYCSNHALIPAGNNRRIPDAEVIDYLSTRLDKYDGVVVTGGEPTLYAGLIPLLQSIKALGLRIKLDTNGTDYITVLYLIEAGLIDYIAMDIKGGGVPITEDQRLLTDLLKCDIIDYEFRSTVYPPYFDKDIYLKDIIWRIAGANHYVLQQYVPVEGRCDIKPFTDDDIRDLAELFKSMVNKISIRGLK